MSDRDHKKASDPLILRDEDRAETAPDAKLIAEIEAIQREQLPAAYYLQARKVADERGLSVMSDYDAVRQLRALGVPIELPRATGTSLVANQSAFLPQTGSGGADAPLFDFDGIKRDMEKRRKRRAAGVIARITAFVVLPTVAAGYWFTIEASPIYASRSEFIIQKPEAAAPAAGMPAIPGASLPGNQDAIAVQGYLTSRAAFEKLDAEHGFRSHFASGAADYFTRIPDTALNDDVFEAYGKHLDVSFDPSEGIVRMSATALDPQTAVEFSNALIGYAETHLEDMTRKMRDDGVASARAAVDRAIREVGSAQSALLEIQERHSVLSGEQELQLLSQQISPLQGRLLEEQMLRDELASNERPNPSRLAVADRRITALEAQIDNLRGSASAHQRGETSLALARSEILQAETELTIRQDLLRQSIGSLEHARAEAQRQARYLSIAVAPSLSDKPEFPKPLLNTALAFLAFLGIYLVTSLTATLIREQMKS